MIARVPRVSQLAVGAASVDAFRVCFANVFDLRVLGESPTGVVLGSGSSAHLAAFLPSTPPPSAPHPTSVPPLIYPLPVVATSNMKKTVRLPQRWDATILEEPAEATCVAAVGGGEVVLRACLADAEGHRAVAYHKFARNPVLSVVLGVESVARTGDVLVNAVGMRSLFAGKDAEGVDVAHLVLGDEAVHTRLVLRPVGWDDRVAGAAREWVRDSNAVISLDVDDIDAVWGSVLRRDGVQVSSFREGIDSGFLFELDGYAFSVESTQPRRE